MKPLSAHSFGQHSVGHIDIDLMMKMEPDIKGSRKADISKRESLMCVHVLKKNLIVMIQQITEAI